MKRIVSRFVLPLCLLLPLLVAAGAHAAAPDAKKALPEGFIALSDSALNWADAKAYCEKQGGKLPRINNNDEWEWAAVDKVERVDGFKAPGAPWPAGLPEARYWAGTLNPDSPNAAWVIAANGGEVGTGSSRVGFQNAVVCVPQ